MLAPIPLFCYGFQTKPQPGDILHINRYTGVVRLLRKDIPLRVSDHPQRGDHLLAWTEGEEPPRCLPGRTTIFTVPEAEAIVKLVLAITGLQAHSVVQDGSITAYRLEAAPS